MCERNVQEMDITCVRNVQVTDRCLQDGYHTDGHYITVFTEQLTRTFEVLVCVDCIDSQTDINCVRLFVCLSVCKSHDVNS